MCVCVCVYGKQSRYIIYSVIFHLFRFSLF